MHDPGAGAAAGGAAAGAAVTTTARMEAMRTEVRMMVVFDGCWRCYLEVISDGF